MTLARLYSFPAQMESLNALLAYLRAMSLGTQPTAILRAETALEELLTNSVVHGGAALAARPSVWLGVSARAGILRLRYQDAADAFDPLPMIDLALHRSTTPMEQRSVGGLGLLMVYRLADAFSYAHANNRNCIDLTFRARAVSA